MQHRRLLISKHYTQESSEEQKALGKEHKLDHMYLLLKEGCSRKIALEVVGISQATYYRWKKLYRSGGLVALEDRPKTPHNLRAPTWDMVLEKRVYKLRKKYPLWGKAKIAVILKREYNVIASQSTVGRILRKLTQLNKIRPASFYYGGFRKRKARVFDGHAQRWKSSLKAKKPGQMIQVDHAFIELEPDVVIKHFKAVCPITKITVEQAYKSATSACAADFFEHAKKHFPFKIESIQVDGGSEFRADFEEKCRVNAIPLYVLPPRSPKKNAFVERANGTVKYEFYYHYQGAMKLSNIRDELQEFVAHYNTFRPHQSLQYLTPWQYYLKNEA